MIGLLSLPIALVMQQTSVLTLSDATQYALENNDQIKVAQSQFRFAVEQSRQALGTLGYRIDMKANYQRYLAENLFAPNTPGSIDAKSTSVTINYPIDLSGTNRKAALAARDNEWAAKQGIDIAANGLKKTVREAYFGVVRAKEGLKVQVASLEAAKVREHNAQIRFDAGDIPRFDLLRLQTERTKSDAAVTNAEDNLTLAKQVLNNNLNRPIETDFEVETVALEDAPELNQEALLKMAIENRPEILQLQYALSSQKFITYAQRGGNTPSLNLSATYQHTFDPSSFQRENQTTLMAVVSFPIFDSGITRAKIRASREQEQQMQLNMSSTKRRIELEVKSAIVRMHNAIIQVAAAKRTVELNTESVRIAQLRFDNGEGILLDLIQAQSDATLAQVLLVNAEYDYRTAYAGLQYAVGSDQPFGANP